MKKTKLTMITLMMCLMSAILYGQDTIVLKNNEKIIAYNLKAGNLPTDNPNIWIKGYYYKDHNGVNKNIATDDIKEIISSESSRAVVIKDSPDLYKNDINLGGYYIEQAGKLKNYAIFCQLIGTGFVILGASQNQNSVTIMGGIIGLASLPLCVVANFKLSKGGNKIKKYKF